MQCACFQSAFASGIIREWPFIDKQGALIHDLPRHRSKVFHSRRRRLFSQNGVKKCDNARKI